jgi:hypothetical protein
MKYALLNHLPLEQFEARKDPALISAWKSYVEHPSVRRFNGERWIATTR